MRVTQAGRRASPAPTPAPARPPSLPQGRRDRRRQEAGRAGTGAGAEMGNWRRTWRLGHNLEESCRESSLGTDDRSESCCRRPKRETGEMRGEREMQGRSAETQQRQPKPSGRPRPTAGERMGPVTSERKGRERRETEASGCCLPRVLLTPGGLGPGASLLSLALTPSPTLPALGQLASFRVSGPQSSHLQNRRW